MDLQTFLLLASLAILAGWAYYTDRKSKASDRKEEFKKKLSRFRDAQRTMPDLIRKLGGDLSDPQKSSFRDIFVVDRNSPFDGGAGALVYYTEDHPDLDASLAALESGGYIKDVTPYNVKKYRMSDEFVEMVLYVYAPRDLAEEK